MSTDRPERVVRRRRGPFRRSRTGCGTCKRRGKKCDEQWSIEGWCERCIMGGFTCSGRTSVPPEPSRTTRSTPVGDVMSIPAPSYSTEGSSSEALPPVSMSAQGGHRVLGMESQVSTVPSSVGVSPNTTVSSTHVTSFGASPLTPASRSLPIDSASSHSSAHNRIAPLTTAPVTTTTLGDHPGILPYSGQWNTSLASSDANRTSFASLFTPPLFAWPDATHSTSMDIGSWADGTLAPDSVSPSASADGCDSDFWNALNASFPPNSMGLNANSRVLFLSSDKPTRQGVSLAEIYARVVESWLVGLPRPTRDYARTRILALNDNNNVLRAVRYAVSVAYIHLFSGTSEPHNENPQPVLVELARRGAGVDTRGASPSRSGSVPSGDGTSGTEGGAVRKIRMYVDHVSNPFAADLESKKWTEDAVQELRQCTVRDRHGLSDLLCGVIDLQLVEFIRGGAAPSYNMLALGDRLVRAAFASEHPSLCLSELRTSETFSLRLFALSDISRCIVERGRRTIFNFSTDHEADRKAPTTPEDESWSTYLGLPDGIVVLLAEVVNLCAAMRGKTAQAIRANADDIEHELRSWAPPSVSDPRVQSTALITRKIASELWRHCALILLYQSVHQVGALHPVLRQSQAEILSLLVSVTQLPNGDLWGFIALPAFLAATLSITEADRQRSMTFLTRTGPERVWLDNIALVEKVWEETDETGRPVDWHDKMVREGLSVAFF